MSIQSADATRGPTALSVFRSRLRLLTAHPEFRRRPLTILVRLAAWELFKVIRHGPTIDLHKASRIRLRPGKQRGIHGLVYIFREAYEPPVRDAIDRFARPGTTCYDIGANIGLWTLRMAESVGDQGSVVAFEPLGRNVRDLRANLAMSGKTIVSVREIGLGAIRGRARLFVPVDPGASSLAAETSIDEVEEVAIERLDDVWIGDGAPSVALVKIDVEGAEPLVIEGGRSFFGHARPVVCCELNPFKLALMGRAPSAIMQSFAELGYRSFMWSAGAPSLVPYVFPGDGSLLRGREVRDLVFVPNERGADLP